MVLSLVFGGLGVSCITVSAVTVLSLPYVLCEQSRQAFLLAYGILSVVIGMSWVSMGVLTFALGEDRMFNSTAPTVALGMVVSFSLLVLTGGVIFSALATFPDCPNSNHPLYAMCLAAFVICCSVIAIAGAFYLACVGTRNTV